MNRQNQIKEFNNRLKKLCEEYNVELEAYENIDYDYEENPFVSSCTLQILDKTNNTYWDMQDV